MATSKATGASRLGRDSQPKYLGVKITDGQFAKAGQILVRQRGTHFIAGTNVGIGGDNTLFALASGTAQYAKKAKKHYDNTRKLVNIVSIAPKKA